MPPGRPRSLALAVVLGLAVTWLGLAVSYFSPYPVGFWITSVAFAAYLVAHVPAWWSATVGRRRSGRRRTVVAAAGVTR